MLVYRFFLLLNISLIIFGFGSLFTNVPHNLFNPYDILLYKPLAPGQRFDFGVVYEGAFRSFGFQTDPDDRIVGDDTGHSNVFRRPVAPLQLWHDSQNFCAALTGAAQGSPVASHASLLNIKGQRLDCNLKVSAHIAVPMNLMLSARFALPYNLVVGFYLPVLNIALKNVTWKEHKKEEATTFSAHLDNFVDSIERLGKVKARLDWQKTAVGDFSAVVWWHRYYVQYKEWLKGVMVSARGGAIFPTGSHIRNEVLFDVPSGHGQGFGALFGCTLEMSFGYHFKLGIDGEFTHFMGSSDKRRFQTDRAQTDLIFLNSGPVHLDPGLRQHYTIFAKAGQWKGWSTMIAYQHTRQQENTVVPALARFDSRLVNDAESVQHWTTHSMAYFLQYDPPGWEQGTYVPRLSFFVKNGFNGKRALLFDTAGVQLNMSY